MDLGVISTWVVVSTAGEHEVTRKSVERGRTKGQRGNSPECRHSGTQGQVGEVKLPDMGGRKKQKNQEARGGEDEARAWDSAWCLEHKRGTGRKQHLPRTLGGGCPQWGV